MGLFKPEHERVLSLLHHDDNVEAFSDLLKGYGRILEDKVLPKSAAIDLKTQGILETRKEFFGAGLCLIPFPNEYGGMGLPFSVYTLAIELSAAADASTALSAGIHNTVADGLYRFGSERQKSELLSKVIRGDSLAAFGLTEPTSGSDAKSLNTHARREGSEFVINGSKMFITNAGEASLYLVFARTEKGPSAFLVDAGSPGMSFGDDIQKLGMKGSRTSEIIFRDCRIPSDNILGEEGQGFEYAKQMLNGSRIVMGSICTGIAQIALDKATSYAKERRAFDRAISDFQLTREKIANSVILINAARLFCLSAARLRDLKYDFSSEAAQAKVFATEMSLRVCDEAIQIGGGYGYTTDDLHRHWRDARLLTIGEGTSEILRMLIAGKELGKDGT